MVREIDTLPLKSNRCSAIITIAGADKRKTYLHLNAFSNFVFNSHAGAKGKRKKIKKENKERRQRGRQNSKYRKAITEGANAEKLKDRTDGR